MGVDLTGMFDWAAEGLTGPFDWAAVEVLPFFLSWSLSFDNAFIS